MNKYYLILIAFLVITLPVFLLIQMTDNSSRNEISGSTIVETNSDSNKIENSENTELTVQEVGEHNSENSCYTIIDGKVYDLTSWISQHPGGKEAILKLCGTDGTSAFRGKHGYNEKQQKILDGLYLGDLEN